MSTTKLRGLRDSVASGTVLGRTGAGSGPPTPIAMTAFMRSPVVSGIVGQQAQAQVVQAMTINGYSLLGNSGAATAQAQGITLPAALDLIYSGAAPTTNDLLYRAAGGWTHAQLTALLDTMAGTAARGAILYRGSTAWLALAAGIAGQVLKTNGPGADPSWGAASGGASYIPLSLGVEPATIVTDGAGNFITIPYSP